MTGPETSERTALPSEFRDAARTGDLVFRQGQSLTSRAVLLSDRDGIFSHVGVAIRRADSVWVVHAAPASEIDDGFVVREPLEVFLGPDRAVAAAVYRVATLPHGKSDTLEAMLERYARHRLPFDGDFDLGTPGQLYCTELAWLAFRSVGIDLLSAGVPTRTTPFGIKRFIFPSDLVASPEVHEVVSFERSSTSRIGLLGNLFITPRTHTRP